MATILARRWEFVGGIMKRVSPKARFSAEARRSTCFARAKASRDISLNLLLYQIIPKQLVQIENLWNCFVNNMLLVFQVHRIFEGLSTMMAGNKSFKLRGLQHKFNSTIKLIDLSLFVVSFCTMKIKSNALNLSLMPSHATSAIFLRSQMRWVNE